MSPSVVTTPTGFPPVAYGKRGELAAHRETTAVQRWDGARQTTRRLLVLEKHASDVRVALTRCEREGVDDETIELEPAPPDATPTAPLHIRGCSCRLATRVALEPRETPP